MANLAVTDYWYNQKLRNMYQSAAREFLKINPLMKLDICYRKSNNYICLIKGESFKTNTIGGTPLWFATGGNCLISASVAAMEPPAIIVLTVHRRKKVERKHF